MWSRDQEARRCSAGSCSGNGRYLYSNRRSEFNFPTERTCGFLQANAGMLPSCGPRLSHSYPMSGCYATCPVGTALLGNLLNRTDPGLPALTSSLRRPAWWQQLSDRLDVSRAIYGPHSERLRTIYECIVAYRPVAKRWLCKQQPLLGNARNMHATVELCFLCGPCPDVITGMLGA
jgi:hypothetical protein